MLECIQHIITIVELEGWTEDDGAERPEGIHGEAMAGLGHALYFAGSPRSYTWARRRRG